MTLRQDRMGDEIRDILATVLTGGQLSDPRLELVTITAVKMTADLQLASVYFRVMADKTTEEVQAGLKSATPLFRRMLGEALDIRRVPNLRFFFDKSIENGERIETLLRQAQSK